MDSGMLLIPRFLGLDSHACALACFDILNLHQVEQMLQQHSEAAISQLRANPDELLEGVQWCDREGGGKVTCRSSGSSGQETACLWESVESDSACAVLWW